MPKEIGNLKNLTNFVLIGRGVEEDHIKTLPKEIGNLNNLTHLTLSCTRLTELPKEIVNLRNLASLYLDGNPYLSLTLEQQVWFNNLERTHLS